MNSLDARGHALLRWHLEHNHHPPVPRKLHRFALKAIEMEGSDEIVCVNGSEFLLDTRGNTVNARQCCDGWHLWDFVHTLQSGHLVDTELGLASADVAELRQIEKDITGE